MAHPAAPLPDPVYFRFDDVNLLEWQDRPLREEESLPELGLLFLWTCMSMYVQKAPFLRFDEGGYELLSRMATELCKMVPDLNKEELVAAFVKQYGIPSLHRRRIDDSHSIKG